MIKKLTLALTMVAATMVASPATAQTEDARAATEDAAKVAPVLSDIATSPELEPATAPESEPQPGESKDEGEDLGTLGQETLDLAKAGKWVAALGAFMFVLIAVFRKFIFHRVDWFQTKKGGYVAAGGIALATIIGLSIKLGFSVDVVLAGLTAAGFATGLHTTANDIKPSAES